MISYPLPGGLSFVGRLAQSRVPAVPKPRHLRARMPAFHSVSLPETPLPVSTGNETAHPSVSSRMLMRVAAGVSALIGARRLISLLADRLDAAASSLEAIDADFHRAEIDRLRDVARIVRSAPVGSKA